MMFSNVVTSTSGLSTTNDLDQVGAIIGFADDGGRKPQIPGIIEIDMVWPVKNGGFLWQPHWSWYSALWVAHWLRWSHSAVACGSVCLICCGAVVCSTHWYNISAGECELLLACYSMLVELSMGLDWSTWHG